MFDPHIRRLTGLHMLLLLLLLSSLSATAYTPGSGTLYSDDFEDLDPDWEMGNGFGSPSPWTLVADGGDTSFLADGQAQFPGGATQHWARHFLHPVDGGTFSVAFEYRAQLTNDYYFQLEVEQRAPELHTYRLHIDSAGVMSLWRSESGVLVQVVSTGSPVVSAEQKRWIRLAIEADPSGYPRVRARVWDGGATSEPSSWTLEFLDELTTIERVHRFEIEADGPRNIKTWIDDLDAFGNAADGVPSSVRTIYLMEVSHLDIGFTEPPDDIEAFSKTHLDQVLNNLDADPDYRWTIESGWFLDRWWERSNDAAQQRMLDHLREGRLKLSSSYANLHTTKVGHEELTRAIYWSTRMGREHGFPVRIFITDDVPGSTFAIPELLARAGIDYFIGGMNTGFGGRLSEPDHGDRPFWWVGPDGSRVLTWHTFDSYAEAFQWGFSFFDGLADMYTKMAQKIPELEETGYPWPELLLMRGFDNHYQGFKARNLADQWNATYETPKFVLSTAEEFLDMMLAKYGPDAFPSYTGDYGCAWSNSQGGAQHTHTWIRQAHRNARAAEALLAAGAALDGDPAADEDRDFMYRKMVESDEHTGAGGWPGYFTREEMDRNNRIHLGYARDARDTAASLLEQGLERATAGLPAAGDAVVVINPLGRVRDGWARIVLPTALYTSSFRVVDRVSGTELPYQRFDVTEEILFRAEGVPAIGYRVYDLRPGTPTAEPQGLLAVTATTLENDSYLLEIDPNSGAVVSLVDKSSGRELVDTASAYRFNELASNTHSEVTYQVLPVAEPPTSATTIIEFAGPLLASLKATRMDTPHVETIYRLYLGDDRIEFENVLDRDLMPYVPNSVGSRSYTVTLPFDIHDFEIRSETTTRFLDPVADSFARTSLFDWHNVEHTLAFWDQQIGVLHAMDNTVAYHFENLSGLTSSAWSTGDALLLPRMKDKSDEYEFDGGSVGPFEVEPDTSPIHRYTHHLSATTPSFDPIAASRFGFEALSPLPTRLLSRGPGDMPDDDASFFSVDAPQVLLYTAKPADIGTGVVFRMTEMTGQQISARLSSEVFELSSPERIEQDEEGGTPMSMDGSAVLVPLGPYETATIRVQAAVGWEEILLMVNKDSEGGTVSLSWSQGVSPYTLRRSDNPEFIGWDTLVDEEAVSSHEDPVLNDGQTYFYLVR
ncbi:MAG: hypothetical protein JSV80_18080 [Acidobacteriota bacterium]|nr:MAG: hypothetical protein JSV80_18080 [Acidobacteriota bacterium]